MELNIENFAKIKEANIIIDGITVIAGENNTGKSTVGKILFSLFNSLHDIDEKILKDRLQTIKKKNLIACILNLGSPVVNDLDVLNHFINNINQELEKEIRSEREVSREKVNCIFEKNMKALSIEVAQEKVTTTEKEIFENTAEVLVLSKDTIIKEIITSYFNRVFATQINTLSAEDEKEATLSLIIKSQKQKLFFENNKCIQYEKNLRINHKAIYIDNPFIVDHLDGSYSNANTMEELLINLLNKKETDIFNGIVEKTLTKEKLQDIYKRLQTVVEGEIIVDKNDTYCLKNERFKEPIILQNLSTGLKSVVIIKLLLEKGCLKEEDVVILDEPEIHLHPQWQIAYAELIVLLQKAFNLSIVVTTHSPYFVDALNLFSCKYETDGKVNYYLASNDGNTVKMSCVSDHIESIYEKMASPIQILDTLRYELNNK